MLARGGSKSPGNPSDALIGFETVAHIADANRSGLHPDDEQQRTRL
jgi:hypothetical protein